MPSQSSSGQTLKTLTLQVLDQTMRDEIAVSLFNEPVDTEVPDTACCRLAAEGLVRQSLERQQLCRLWASLHSTQRWSLNPWTLAPSATGSPAALPSTQGTCLPAQPSCGGTA